MGVGVSEGELMVFEDFRGERDNGGEDLAARAGGIECISKCMCVC